MAWTLVGLLALFVSVVYHLQVDLAGLVIVDTVTSLLNRTIQGSLEIGELQNLSYSKIVARRVILRDPQGRPVIRVARLAAWPNWGALWDGVIFVDRARARGGEVVLHVAGEEEDTVSLVEAFLPVEPGEPGGEPPPRIIVDGIVLDEILVRGNVPSYEGLRVENVRMEARIEAQSDVNFRVFDGRGEMTGPYPGRTQIDRIVGHFNTDMTDGLDAYARAHRREDRVRARIRLWEEEDAAEDDPLQMDLTVHIEPVRMETLAEMEIAPGLDNLTGTFRGSGRLAGPVDSLRLRADVTSEGGRLIGRGHLPSDGPMTFEAWTHGDHRLDQLVPAAPQMRVGTHATLTLEDDPQTGEQIRTLHAEVSPVRYEEIVIPGFTVDGLIGDDELEITDLDTVVADGEASGTGTVGYDGSLDVEVSATIPEISRDPNVRRYAPDARGSLVTRNLRLSADAEMTNLRGSGTVAMRRFRYGAVRADTLRVSGRVGGEMPSPTASLEGEATGLVVGGLRLGTAEVGLHGGPGGYDVSASSADAATGTRVAVEGRARLTEESLGLEASSVLVDVGDGAAWRGDVDLTVRFGHSVRVDGLRLARPGESIQAQGTYRFRGDDDFTVDFEHVTLDGLERIDPDALEGIGGRLSGHLRVGGDLDRRPQGELIAELYEGTYRGLTDVDGRVELRLEDETLGTELALDLGPRGRLFARGPVELTERALRDPGSHLVEDADLSQLDIRADNLDLGAIATLTGSDAAISGRISTDVTLGGSPLDPQISEAVVVLDQVSIEGWDPVRAKLHMRYGQDRVQVSRLWVADVGGELISGEASLPLDLEDLPENGADFWRQLHEGTWSASLRLASRRLDSYPAPIGDRMPPGIEASASLTGEGDAGGPRVSMSGVVRVAELSLADDHCSSELRPAAIIRAGLLGDQLRGEVRGFGSAASAANGPAVTADLSATLPLQRWVEAGEVQIPSTEVQAQFDGLDLSELPYACAYGTGPIYGTANLQDLFSERPTIGVIIDLPRLRLWESVGPRSDPTLSPPFEIHVRGGTTEESDALTACAILSMSGTPGTDPTRCRAVGQAAEGEAISRLRVPVTWTAGELLPGYEETATISSWNDFANVRAEPVLTFIPGIVGGDAILDGEVRAEGPWATIQLDGQLDISDGHIQIEGLGQHLSNIEGRVVMQGDRVIFPTDHPLRASDSGGTAQINGRVEMQGVFPSTLSLRAVAQAFPIRREGMVLAWLSGEGRLSGPIRPEETLATLEVRDFVVRLPEQTAASLQPLELHPQVLVVGSERMVTGPARDSYPIEIRVDAADPFWVRRNDFAALLTADITAIYADPDFTVEGWARLERGTFEIFGKRFELQPGGRIIFDGGTEMNPQVQIVAVYEIPGRAGSTVTVEVTGSLEEPHVSFRSTETADQAEIIALLVSGGRGGGNSVQDATEQASSFLSGLTFGLATLTLRQEFGDYIPILSIESPSFGGARVRAGFDADELIPDFLQGIVTGLYIEGFVTAAAEGQNAAGTSAGGGGVGGGLSVEATFPNNLLLRGSYVPIDNGGLDLLIEP